MIVLIIDCVLHCSFSWSLSTFLFRLVNAYIFFFKIIFWAFPPLFDRTASWERGEREGEDMQEIVTSQIWTLDLCVEAQTSKYMCACSTRSPICFFCCRDSIQKMIDPSQSSFIECTVYEKKETEAELSWYSSSSPLWRHFSYFLCSSTVYCSNRSSFTVLPYDHAIERTSTPECVS